MPYLRPARGRVRRADQHHDLALRRGLGGVGRGQRSQQIAPHLLEPLGQLAGHRRPAGSTQRLGHVDERIGQPAGAFIEDQRRRDLRQLGQRRLPRAGLGRQEAGEQEPVGRQPGQRQGGQQRRSARHCDQVEPLGQRRLDQPVTRVGDQRRAGVGAVGDAPALAQPGNDPRPPFGGVAVVVGEHRTPGKGNAVNLHQLARLAGVLGGDGVGPGQHVEGAQCDIGGVADRGGNEV